MYTELFLKNLFASTNDAVLTIDDTQRIVLSNPPAEKMFGYGEGELLDRPIHDLLPPSARNEHVKQVQQFVDSTEDAKFMSERDVLHGCRKDESTFPLEVTISRFISEEKTYCTAIVRDVTQKVRSAGMLRESLSIMEDAVAMKNRFFGMAAHDLRSPIAKLQLVSELLLDDKVTEDQKEEFCRIVRRTTESMLLLINDLLDMTRIESGKIDLHTEEVEVSNYLDEIVRENMILGEAKSINTQISCPPSISSITVDPERLKQVFVNLLSNAYKFSPPETMVCIAATQEEKQVRFEVLDEGPGIPDGERQQLFSAFVQLSNRPTAGEASTGLGLAICKKLVELHGGEIGASNRPSGGSCFWFTVPVAHAQ